MKTRIVSAFPGTGKTHYCKLHSENTLDSDSSKFSWIAKGVRNPCFPTNYIRHIKENIGKYDFIFVSSHREVRKALLENCLHFYLLYPDANSKQEYLDRYRERNSHSSFIHLLNENWSYWIRECEFELYGCTNIRMVFKYIDSEIRSIICSENGDKL